MPTPPSPKIPDPFFYARQVADRLLADDHPWQKTEIDSDDVIKRIELPIELIGNQTMAGLIEYILNTTLENQGFVGLCTTPPQRSEPEIPNHEGLYSFERKFYCNIKDSVCTFTKRQEIDDTALEKRVFHNTIEAMRGHFAPTLLTDGEYFLSSPKWDEVVTLYLKDFFVENGADAVLELKFNDEIHRDPPEKLLSQYIASLLKRAMDGLSKIADYSDEGIMDKESIDHIRADMRNDYSAVIVYDDKDGIGRKILKDIFGYTPEQEHER